MKRQGWYEKVMLEDIMRREPKGVAIDVGAYCGTHTLWFALMCSMQVVALEPVQESFDALVHNVTLNKLADQVMLLNVAAGAKPSIGRFERHDKLNTGTDTIVDDGEGNIPIITIDSLNLHDVGLIKIDVEGAELDVLEGAKQTIDSWGPLIYIEAPDTHAQVTQFMAQREYYEFGQFNATPTFGFIKRTRSS